MNIEPDEPAARIEEVVAARQEQLKEGRKLMEASNRLAASTEEQASTANELVQETGQLIDVAHATIQKVDALADHDPLDDQQTS